MKSFLVITLVFVSLSAFSQNNHIVKTDDGRRVLLKADFTWEYIDLEVPKAITNEVNHTTLAKTNSCKITANFEEPKLDNKIQNQLKKGRATITHIKKKVAKDLECNFEDVILLSVSENKSAGTYHFCANGTKVTYKRMGHNITKKLELF
ncbi:DUF3157 family protein [Seonamhaeicola sp. MEBiC1930]|uniref:DUF3157 family protein n=1 Tax=Seonamhaeicola sp. MEBiC01930 TaxID=2976768 RepID=UPI00324956F0